MIRALLQQVAAAGRERLPLWVYGEPGVDLETICRGIHAASAWATGSFLAVDLSAIRPDLVRREILGAAAGAIPALPGEHEGILSRPRQGTVLLEGLEKLSKEIQAELAQAIGSGRFQKLGSSVETSVESRVIAGGSVPLETLVQKGKLVRPLADLLSTREVRFPALRERREDIPLVAAQALSEIRAEIEGRGNQGCTVRTISTGALQRLVGYDWPGNERELREQIRAAVGLARGEELQPEDFVLGWSGPETVPSFRDAKRAFEREYVTRLLRLCKGNISQAARLAKKDRKDFYDVMRRNEINPVEFRK